MYTHTSVYFVRQDFTLTILFVPFFQIQPSAFVNTRTLRRGTVARKHVRSRGEPRRTQNISVPSRLQFGHHCADHVESYHQLSPFRFCALQMSVK